MTSVMHLWNISKFLEKIQNPEVAKLRMHYVQCCREQSDEVELPKQNFGPAVLCSRCGSTWATTKHKTRILPRRNPPSDIQNLMCVTKDTGSRLPKYRRTLIRKSEKNKANKIIKICSVCSNSTTFSLSKPERQKKPKSNPLDSSKLSLSSKKKKKRSKDKTAGLNLSGIGTPETNRTAEFSQDKYQTPLLGGAKKNLSKTTPSSVLKPQKMNLSKLKGLFDTNTPSKKNKLRAFLQEL